MASRRKEKAAVKAIVALAFLLVFAWTFSPAFRALVMLVIYIAVASALAYGVFLIAKWLITRKRGTGTSFPEGRTFYDITPVDTVAGPTPHQPAIPKAEITPSLTREYIRARLRQIDWFQFEKLVELVYLNYGYGVTRSGGANPDGGIDLTIETPEGRLAIQCKHWKSWTVGVSQIREFVGAMKISGIAKGNYFTMRGYTNEARDLGCSQGIQLYDEEQIVELIFALERTRSTEVLALLSDTRKFCPKCEREMILRTAGKGANAGQRFWGCSNYPRCKFTMKFDGQS